MGITIQPQKFFSNAKKVISAGEGLNIKEALQEQKAYFQYWQSIHCVDHNLLIDYNGDIHEGYNPFVVALQSGNELLIFNKYALALAAKTALIMVDAVDADATYPKDTPPLSIHLQSNHWLVDKSYIDCVNSPILKQLLQYLISSPVIPVKDASLFALSVQQPSLPVGRKLSYV